MELEQLGKLVAEALALQGRVLGMEEEIKDLDRIIDVNSREIERLADLSEATDKVIEQREELAGELSALKAEVEKQIKELGKEGVLLPIGEKAGAKRVSL